MPINEKEMAAMKKEYGKEKGEDVYYATENKRKHKGKESTQEDTPPSTSINPDIKNIKGHKNVHQGWQFRSKK